MIVFSPCCECVEAKSYISHLHQQRLLMFLMGLNETSSHVRSDILLKTETPSVNQAYFIVVQEESQHVLGVVESNKEPLTLLAGRGQHYKGKKPLLAIACEICGFKNHLTADCYRLVGYPSDFKSKRKPAQSGHYQTGTPGPYQTGMGNCRSTQQCSYQTGMGSFNSSTPNHTGNSRLYANNAAADRPIQDHIKLSNKELDQFRNLVHNKEQHEYNANLAGNVLLLPKFSAFE